MGERWNGRVENMSMAGAPAYELCCVAPCILGTPCTRPSRAIVMSMGGNDYMWLPAPFVHECLSSRCGLDGPTAYMRCFLWQTTLCSPSLSQNVAIVWINDDVVGTMSWGGGAYKRYCSKLREVAGIVVEPNTSDNEMRAYMNDDESVDRGILVPTFNYHVRRNVNSDYPSFVFLDSSPLMDRMKLVLSADEYARLWTGCESSERLLRLWETWIVSLLSDGSALSRFLGACKRETRISLDVDGAATKSMEMTRDGAFGK